MIRAWLKRYFSVWINRFTAIMLAIALVIGVHALVSVVTRTGWDSEQTRQLEMWLSSLIPLAVGSILYGVLLLPEENCGSAGQIKDIIALINKRKIIEFYCALIAVFLISTLSIMLGVGKNNQVFTFIGPILGGILLVLCVLDHAITWYRMRCGLYGTCESEAREIISFMLEQKSKNGDGGGKMTLRFTQEELEKIVAPNESGGEAHA